MAACDSLLIILSCKDLGDSSLDKASATEGSEATGRSDDSTGEGIELLLNPLQSEITFRLQLNP